MDMKNLGINDVDEDILLLQIDGVELEEKEDLIKENEKLKQELEEKAELEKRNSDADLENMFEEVRNAEKRKAKALTILEKEEQLQIERELDWKKERRNKKISRFVKMFVIVVVVGFVALALKGGYRILLPDEVANHLEGIFNTAKEVIEEYFVKKG